MYALLLSLGVLVSCGLQELGGEDGKADDIWIGPGSVIVGNGGQTGPGKKVWYAVGVDYPNGYDWRTDDQKGHVKCSLVVFANGVPMMKVPVGDQYEVSSDPDTYRMLGGDLYTDYSTESETVIKRNGELLFRYPGREMIVDMVVKEDMVYTLGQDRDGDGFSYRLNGEVLLERSSGYPFHHLQIGEDGNSLAFCEVIGAGGDAHERYYHYLAGEVCQIAVREDIKKVWDVVFLEDKVCYLASVVGIDSPVLAAGSELSPLKIPLSVELRNCRFVQDSDDLNIEGVMFQRRKVIFSGLWKGTDLIQAFPSGYTVASMCGSGDGISCVLNAPREGLGGLIYRGGESFEMPEGYMSMGGNTSVIVDGMLYVGLTSITGECACIWVENEMKPLKINGFISHMAID